MISILHDDVDFMVISVLHSDGDECNDDGKGDGVCDDVNNRADCNYDYGDCCNKQWIGDGECDNRNNFTGCTNNAGTDQSWGSIDAVRSSDILKGK